MTVESCGPALAFTRASVCAAWVPESVWAVTLVDVPVRALVDGSPVFVESAIAGTATPMTTSVANRTEPRAVRSIIEGRYSPQRYKPTRYSG
jgi:hypothetical protein